jgi:hypothetical protein
LLTTAVNDHVDEKIVRGLSGFFDRTGRVSENELQMVNIGDRYMKLAEEKQRELKVKLNVPKNAEMGNSALYLYVLQAVTRIKAGTA